MTISGTVNRFARLRSGTRTATVTRVRADDGAAPVYLVESWTDAGPTFTPCGTWRAALDVAARAITTANVRAWD